MLKSKNQVVIIIPFYKDHLTANEAFSLNQCFKILHRYTIVAIKPLSLDFGSLGIEQQFAEVVSFEDKYFRDIHGYNELMLSSMFYKRFLVFKYMLIYQLDAFVFSDQLEYWCAQDYDYIGAPWLRPQSLSSWAEKPVMHIKSLVYRRYNFLENGIPKSKQLFNQVGNGGFSLRRVQKFYKLSNRFREVADDYISRRVFQFNEDVFWSIELNRKEKNLVIPNFKTAAKFAIESEPEIGFKLIDDNLPFGTHAWEKNLDFWSSILENFRD